MLTTLNRTQILMAVWIIISLILCVFAHFLPRFPGDLQVSLSFQSIHNDHLLTALKITDVIFEKWCAAIIVIVSSVIIWRFYGRLAAGMALLAGCFTIINDVLKLIINRPRPTADLVNVFVIESSKSFPSGHSFFSALFLGMLAYLIIQHQSRREIRMLILSAFLLLILWIGASRIYLGVHWISDVIGGYFIGSLILVVQIRLYQRLKRVGIK